MSRIDSALRLSFAGIAVGVLLATIKLVAGLVGNSYALIADAVESFSDIVSAAIVWSGLAISVRPPDDNHPYGHGKAEPLAALAVGLLLIAAAVGIAAAAVAEIRTPKHAPEAFTLVVLAVVIVVKEAMYRVYARVAKQIESTAIAADSWHHRSDAITSLIAAIGITISLWMGPGYESADNWAAAAASVVIAFNGARFVRKAMAELMDTKPSATLLSQLSTIAMTVPGVLGVEKVLGRKMGTQYLVDMHIEVDPNMAVRDAHDIAHTVKNKIRADLERVSDVLVHIEPFEQCESCTP